MSGPQQNGGSRNGKGTSLYLCIKQFNSRLGDELNLKVGDKVQVLADDSEYNDGWYMGKNLSTGKVGLYPKSFTQVLVEDTSEDLNLLRSRSRSRRVASGNSNSSNPNSPVSKIRNSFEHMSVSNKSPSFAKSSDKKLNEPHDEVNEHNDTFNKTNPIDEIDDNPNDDDNSGVNKTMNDIDKALQELQFDSYIHRNAPSSKGHKRASSTLSLTDDLNPKDAINWTPKQVTSYFALGLGFDANVAGKFARHKITGAILFELDLAHLKELDIDSFGTRFEIYREIENLKKMVNEQKLTIKETTEDTKEPAPEPEAKLLLSARISSSNSNAVYTHQRKKSQSYENLQEASKLTSPKLDKGFKFGGAENVDSLYSNKNVSTGGLHPPSQSFSSPGRGLSRPSSSIYEQSVHSRNHSRNISNSSDHYNNHHRRNSSVILSNNHKRNSSLFSFLSRDKEDPERKGKDAKDKDVKKQDKLISPVKIKKQPPPEELKTPELNKHNEEDEGDDEDEGIDIDHAQFSPRKLKSINYKVDAPKRVDFKDEKRSVSDSSALVGSGSETSTPKSGTVSRFKTLRTASTTNFKNLTSSKKLKTSAFQEGIRNITPDEAIKTANYSGFMAKKSGNNLSWRSRYFTLHGTRLSYFTSLKDKKEKGLIDITAHKVIPINSEGEDKYVALYAASTGLGRYCFKLVPPAPGFKKGLTFTQPKVHFFAVETQDEMRGWLKALMTATIDIDDSVPVVSSCSTPTVSLAKAQELLAKAREETKLKDEGRQLGEGGFLDLNMEGGDDDFSEAQLTSFIGNYTLDPNTSGENSPLVESTEDITSSPSGHPKLSIDTSLRSSKGPTTPQFSHQQGGFASPYLLASGLLSPKLNSGNGNFSPTIHNDESTNSTTNSLNHTINTSKASNNSNNTTPVEQKREYFPDDEAPDSTPKLVFSSGGRVLSQSSGGKKKRHSEKLLAYSNDGSGNHTFFIRQKR